MYVTRSLRQASSLLALATLGLLGACGNLPSSSRSEHACMARAMYFESIRSSDEGMLAVGTVVMNRVKSGQYPKTVCGVVGQKNQFAPGVLSKSMTEKRSRERAERVARAVLAGKRHRGVGNAMFFHTAGRTYRYKNMHYVLVAGGNAFYERKPTPGRRYIARSVIAQSGPRTSVAAVRIPSPSVADPGHLLAAAPGSAPPRFVPPPPVSIEAIILANAGL